MANGQDGQDALTRVGLGLKTAQVELRRSAQHAADVASLMKEVAGRREEVKEWVGKATRLLSRVKKLEAQLDAIVGRTDRLGFGRRMA